MTRHAPFRNKNDLDSVSAALATLRKCLYRITNSNASSVLLNLNCLERAEAEPLGESDGSVALEDVPSGEERAFYQLSYVFLLLIGKDCKSNERPGRDF